MSLLDAILAVLSLPVVAGTGYLLWLTLLSRRLEVSTSPVPATFFRIVVPAHNEELGIGDTVKSLKQLDYPADKFDIVVVADNCKDATADRARAAGAHVLERQNDQERGKGYALHYAFSQLPEHVDAVVVIDADTLVSANLLRAFDVRLAAGAPVVQADYAVRNPKAAWRTCLMAIAFGCFHIVRSRGRERMGVSCGLRGNGMCFSTRILQAVPHHAYSIVEDVEYGIRLGEAGFRVHYADEAHVYGEMVTSAAASRSQRARWEGGRAALARAHGTRLLKAGLAKRSLVLWDLGVDVLLPPLSRLALAACLGWVLAAGLQLRFGTFPLSFACFAFATWALVLYVVRGWMVSGTGVSGLSALAMSPVYVVWKVLQRKAAKPKADAEWVRTTREAGEPKRP
jgi:1,2-diacylglycerol 3-beta-glucosyltransferase